MLTPETLEQFRPGTWLRAPHRGRPGTLSNRLLVLVPLTAEEMALSLSIPLEQARTLASEDPMYFCLRQRRLNLN